MKSNTTAISNDEMVKQNERLQTILDSVSSAVFEISLKGNILFANQAAVHIFGYAQTEFKNMFIADLIPDK